MLKKFIGISDDGFRLYECYTPGEAKGDVGIKMVIGYRNDEFKVYSSEVWDDPTAERLEALAQSAAASSRVIQAHFNRVNANRGKSKTGLQMYEELSRSLNSFNVLAPIEVRTTAIGPSKQNIVKARPYESMLFDELYFIDTPKLPADKQGQPKRKPQPNRGPIGRKDWK